MKRTIAIKIDCSKESCKALDELRSTFSACCNRVAEIAEKTKETNRVRLYHESYYELRDSFPQLGSQMTCNAIAKAAFALKGLKKKKKIQFKEKSSVHFDKRTYSLKGNTLSLFTLQGRMRFTFITNPFHQHYLEIGKPKEAELIFRGNAWYFNLVLDIPEAIPIQSGKKIGVDLGENNLAALSTGKLLGGGSLRNQRGKYLAYRKRLQSNGSQSAKQRLRKISGRERRHVKHVNHNIAKIIIEEARQSGCGIIIMEDLKNIRSRIKTNKRERTRLHRWAFDQLRQFIEYKAQAQGIKVVYVNPAYTSQTCSCCKNLGVRNKHLFFCSNCGNRQHSDLNASRNLALFDISADMLPGDVNHRYVAA